MERMRRLCNIPQLPVLHHPEERCFALLIPIITLHCLSPNFGTETSSLPTISWVRRLRAKGSQSDDIPNIDFMWLISHLNFHNLNDNFLKCSQHGKKFDQLCHNNHNFLTDWTFCFPVYSTLHLCTKGGINKLCKTLYVCMY